MKTVRDAEGTRYLLRKRSTESSLVYDPETGEERYLPNDRLEEEEGSGSPLETAAAGVDPAVRTLLSAVHDDETLGLVIALADRGPIAVRQLLDGYGLCESDLHGRLAELVAAGLVEEATVAGERGYRATGDCRVALEIVRPDAGS
ncbi:hypothetical protein [Saliphagus sp. LR7]|uniref:DUF7346 family protein n=1 Tax=Saliphagus sp. LR7 TaxID=2282654 RepID=UPI000DF75415|nr:hypothetical protein [Saliphagus sp. LR7]